MRLVRCPIEPLDFDNRNTRSHGTSTSSKKTMQSISSKRELKGWSKCERPRSKLSRQRNLRPGVPQGIAKLTANRSCPSLWRQPRRINRDLVR